MKFTAWGLLNIKHESVQLALFRLFECIQIRSVGNIMCCVSCTVYISSLHDLNPASAAVVKLSAKVLCAACQAYKNPKSSGM